MLRTVTIATLVVAGFALIAMGVESRLTHEAAAGTVAKFMNALQRGDRSTVLACLSFERRTAAERNMISDTLAWPGLDEVTWRVHHTRAGRQDATVALWAERQGFVLQPVFHLVRSESGTWQIDRIERLEIDPRWDDLEAARQRYADEKLTRELTEALEQVPGVAVERGSSEGFVP